MNDSIIPDKPEILPEIEAKSKEIEFSMPSDYYVGSLLKTLIASKPKSRLLELGTGIGLSLSWMIDGMDGANWINGYIGEGFDLVFADAWPNWTGPQE